METERLIRTLQDQTQAMDNLTNQIEQLVQMNQQILSVLIDVMAGDNEQGHPMCDMEGNPV